jgi:aspartate aminotransferase
MRLANRMARLGTENAFEVLARARALEAEGRHIVHLEIGEPDFDTPENIIAAATDALHHGHTHYTPSAGISALREAIAADASRRKNITVAPAEVVVTPGAKPIIFFTILALINSGDEVLYPNPGFPIYESMIKFVGGSAVPIVLEEQGDFSIDVERLRHQITDKTRLLILNTPHNPTGSILSRSTLEAIATEVLRHPDLMVLADEIYSRISYDGEPVSIASFPGMRERTIVLDGFSKTYAMTGWRLGYGIMPEPLAQHISALMTNSNSCTAAFTQVAGIEALAGPQDPAAAMVAEFRQRRDVIVSGLNRIHGITCRMPHGAFYVFPNITGTGMTSQQLADKLLYEGGVASLSGTSFGAFGEGYLRLSYANSIEQIKLALRRIAETVG